MFSVSGRLLHATFVAAVLLTIPLGSHDLLGGSTHLGSIDAAALDPAGTNATGSVVNELGGGQPITSFTFTISGGTADSVQVDGIDGTFVFDDGKATVTYTGGDDLGGNASAGFTINGLQSDGKSGELELFVTPGVETAVHGNRHVASAFRSFSFEGMSSARSHGIRRTWRRASRAHVENVDTGDDLIALNGTVTAGGRGAAILAVELHDNRGNRVPGVSSAVSSNTFALSGFRVGPAESVFVVVLLGDSPAGDSVELDLEATFSP